MFIVYAIKSKSRNYIYVGLTSNLQERLRRHNKGYEKTTSRYKPFRLIYSEEVLTRPKAREREIYLKSGAGKEFLKSFYQFTKQELVDLSASGGRARFRV